VFHLLGASFLLLLLELGKDLQSLIVALILFQARGETMARRFDNIMLVRGIGRPRLVIGKYGDCISILFTVACTLMLINERYHLGLLFLRLVRHHGLQRVI